MSVRLALVLSALLFCHVAPAQAARALPRRVPAHQWSHALLRNQATAVLAAPLDSVWALVGDPARLPEYSGVVKVEVDRSRVTGPGDAGCRRRCTFPGGETFDEVVFWADPPYAFVSGAPAGPSREAGDVSVVTLEPLGERHTLFTWRQYYDFADLAPVVAEYERGINEIADRLVKRFGGYVVAPSAMRAEAAPAR